MNDAVCLMSPTAVRQRLQGHRPGYLIDVRTTGEYAEGHALGALSMPLEELDRAELSTALGVAAGQDIPVNLICASGQRAQTAAEKLQAQGLTNVVVVDGGTKAWAAQRLPMRRNSKLLSLARQTQIAIGLLLLLTLIKGFLLHPVFYLLIGVLGGGLVFSGITGSCGLAALLAHMPWNRAATERTA
jgi:rhodanese-related sulfurtransferase